MFVWPNIFDTTSIGIPDPRAMVVAKVWRPTCEVRCFPILVSSSISLSCAVYATKFVCGSLLSYRFRIFTT